MPVTLGPKEVGTGRSLGFAGSQLVVKTLAPGSGRDLASKE